MMALNGAVVVVVIIMVIVFIVTRKGKMNLKEELLCN
jgi:hypothetical protein